MARKKKIENQELPIELEQSIQYKYKGKNAIYNLIIFFKKENHILVTGLEVSKMNRKITPSQFVSAVGSNKLMLILEAAFLKEKVIQKKDPIIFSSDLQFSQ